MRRRRMVTNTETYRIHNDMRARVQVGHSISVNDNLVPFVASLLDPARLADRLRGHRVRIRHATASLEDGIG